MPSLGSYLVSLAVSAAFLPALAQAQSTTKYGACVTTCISSNLKSSACNGDETGSALDQCICASFAPQGDPLITCIQACPQDQQLQYANNLPALCNHVLFPNLDLSSATSASAENTAATASAPATGSASATASSSKSAGETASATAGASSNNASSTPSKTSSGAAASGSAGSGDAAMVGAGAGVLGYAAYVAGVAALL